MTPILTLRGLRLGIRYPRATLEIVRGVDLDVMPGEKLALVGESGSGKTLTMLSVLRLLPTPVQALGGSVSYDGRDLLTLAEPGLRAVRGGEIAMVYQDPMSSLNPLLRIGTQLVEALTAHGRGNREARRLAVSGLAEVALPDPERVMAAYPHELSGGMLQRVMIAMALSTSPRVLIADEPTTALDVTIQEQILRLVADLQARHHMAVVWVTHDLGVVARLVDRVAVMYAGRVVEQAPTLELFKRPEHPYTSALLASLPGPGAAHRALLRQIGGTPPDPAHLPGGCPFRVRCPSAADICAAGEPDLLERAPGRSAACWKRPDEWTV
jgi:oligopeptide/dipeptide ABC transporter ATP-binding protein